MDKRDLIREKLKQFSPKDREKIKDMVGRGIDCLPQVAKELKISQQSLNKYLKLLL